MNGNVLDCIELTQAHQVDTQIQLVSKKRHMVAHAHRFHCILIVIELTAVLIDGARNQPIAHLSLHSNQMKKLF